MGNRELRAFAEKWRRLFEDSLVPIRTDGRTGTEFAEALKGLTLSPEAPAELEELIKELGRLWAGLGPGALPGREERKGLAELLGQMERLCSPFTGKLRELWLVSEKGIRRQTLLLRAEGEVCVSSCTRIWGTPVPGTPRQWSLRLDPEKAQWLLGEIGDYFRQPRELLLFPGSPAGDWEAVLRDGQGGESVFRADLGGEQQELSRLLRETLGLPELLAFGDGEPSPPELLGLRLRRVIPAEEVTDAMTPLEEELILDREKQSLSYFQHLASGARQEMCYVVPGGVEGLLDSLSRAELLTPADPEAGEPQSCRRLGRWRLELYRRGRAPAIREGWFEQLELPRDFESLAGRVYDFILPYSNLFMLSPSEFARRRTRPGEYRICDVTDGEDSGICLSFRAGDGELREGSRVVIPLGEQGPEVSAEVEHLYCARPEDLILSPEALPLLREEEPGPDIPSAEHVLGSLNAPDMARELDWEGREPEESACLYACCSNRAELLRGRCDTDPEELRCWEAMAVQLRDELIPHPENGETLREVMEREGYRREKGFWLET